MNLNETPVNSFTPTAAPTPLDTDRGIWDSRLRAGLRVESLADVLAQSQTALALAETVAGLVATAGHESGFAQPDLVLTAEQRRVLLNGVHFAARAASYRLSEVFLDDAELTQEGLAAMRSLKSST